MQALSTVFDLTDDAETRRNAVNGFEQCAQVAAQHDFQVRASVRFAGPVYWLFLTAACVALERRSA